MVSLEKKCFFPALVVSLEKKACGFGLLVVPTQTRGSNLELQRRSALGSWLASRARSNFRSRAFGSSASLREGLFWGEGISKTLGPSDS